jgi:hypothetical protein
MMLAPVSRDSAQLCQAGEGLEKSLKRHFRRFFNYSLWKNVIFLFFTFEADFSSVTGLLASIRFVVSELFLSLQARFVPAILIVFS